MLRLKCNLLSLSILQQIQNIVNLFIKAQVKIGADQQAASAVCRKCKLNFVQHLPTNTKCAYVYESQMFVFTYH